MFYISDSDNYRRCLEDTVLSDGSHSFYDALMAYLSLHVLHPILTTQWYDLGHSYLYSRSRMEVKPREFNDISVDVDRSILMKKSKDVNKFIGEIEWYLKLPSELQYCTPRIYSYSNSFSNPFIKMEYYPYHTVHSLFINDRFSDFQWRKLLERVRFVFNDMSQYTYRGEFIKESLSMMYLDKTQSRLHKVISDSVFRLFSEESFSINGKSYLPFKDIIAIILDQVSKRLLNSEELCIIHGDLCFPNILIDDNIETIKLVDSRGKFGRMDIYGDMRYDLAKLLHSIEGRYDMMIESRFTISIIRNDIQYNLQGQEVTDRVMKCFLQVFGNVINDNIDDIRFIESLLFFTMIPLHSECKQRQIVMFARGVELLSQVCDIRLSEGHSFSTKND